MNSPVHPETTMQLKTIQALTETFCDRIGAADFSKVAEFGAWLAAHPKRRDICCYLLDTVEQKSEPAGPS